MGLKLGRLFKKAAPFIGAAGGFFLGGPGGAAAGFRAGAAFRPMSRAAAFAGGGIGAGVPSIEQFTGVPALFAQPVVQRNGGVMVTPAAAGAIAPLAMGLSRAVISAILRLGSALGIAVTAANVSRVGLRLWRSVTALARRHPGLSILAFLTGLGLAADEAAEFLFWGQSRARRRRGRGISARDIRICRRTIRKMSAFRRDLGGLGISRRPGGRRALRGGGGVVIAQQD